MKRADMKRALQEMDEYEFEYLVADLWELDGWEATVSQASNDDGIDVTAVKKEPFDRKELIQAKRYSDGTSVGGPDIQQYASLQRQEPGVDSVAIVTTSSFTQSAERMAENLNVKIVDGDGLTKWIETADEDILGRYIDRSVSNAVPSSDITEFTESGLAEKIAGYPANQSDESLNKIDKLRKLFKEHVELEKESNQSVFIDTHFEVDGNVGRHYQIAFGFDHADKLIHNMTRLPENSAAKIHSFAKEEELEIIEDESRDGSGYIQILTENCNKDQYRGYYDIWIAIRILYEGYGVEFEEILRANHHGYISEFAWNEMSSSETKSDSDTETVEADLSPEERAEKLASKATSESVTTDRLMGKGKHFFNDDYIHENPIVEYLGVDEHPRYFFYNETKGVRINDNVIKSGWGGGYRNSMLVTNKGVHFFVGQTKGDFHEFLNYDSIERIEARVGMMKNRLIFESGDEIYNFPTSLDADEVEKVSRYA